VGSIERIQRVAQWALDSQAKGFDIVLVVSAMSGETNRLVELATQINPIPYSSEYDLLIASGEQVAVGLVTLAINTQAQQMGSSATEIQSRKIAAKGFLGHHIGIRTDRVFSKARIQAIDTVLLKKVISEGVIPVIAGFQGVDPENNITTLGRGGSDTSAVAIAAALEADDCEIYTDVDGVYTTDPRLCQEATKIRRISYEEMMELASLGAKVLQIRSVELAAKYQIPLHVRSSFQPVPGTRVVSRDSLGEKMEQVVVAGVAADPSQVKFTLQNLPESSGGVAKIFGALSEADIVVDIIVQDVPSHRSAGPGQWGNGGTLSFTVSKPDFLKARKVLEDLKETQLQGCRMVEEEGLAKVSVVGVGMQHHPGVASKMFALLAASGIPIKLISTSEIKISCLIAEGQMKQAVESLHRGFELHRIE